MKKTLIIGAAVVALVGLAIAATPNYKTLSAGGNATSGAEVIFPTDPATQIRLVSVSWQCDSNVNALSYSYGTTAYTIAITNGPSSGVTNGLNSTNGLANSGVLVLEHLGVGYSATISSYASNATYGNFVTLASGGFGVVTSTNDSVYIMSSATTIPVGATTNAANGEALYVAGISGRPVRVKLDIANITNRINAAVARYE